MQTGRLGNAEWISPADFAERCPYEPGTFWVGRDPTSGQPLGYIDDRHILLGSGNRAGKGTTTLINNLCLWPGSVVVVDPKGENATVTAARRGNGSEYCEGLGQKVCVLDPFGASKVDAGYRGSYNPLDELDPNDPDVGDIAGKIASAIVVENPNVKDPFWQQSARKMVKGIILHVLTAPLYEGRRNLLTVRQLINRGDREGVEMLKADGATGVPSGHSLLWQGMSKNEALGDVIAGIGEQMVELTLADQKLFQSMLQSVDRETEWLDSGRMRECVASSSLRLSELKSNEQGVSLYLCLPEGHTSEHSRWLRMMLTLVLQTFETTEGQPASGHRCLMVMDEFLGLKRIEAVERAASYIAGFGITMVFVVQGFSPLKAIYGEGWEIIVGNCGLKIFFAFDEPFGREYISKMIGETEVRTSLHSEGRTSGESTSISESSSRSVTDTRSESRSVGSSRSTSSTVGESRTDGQSFNVSDTVGRSDSTGETSGRSVGKSLSHGTSDGATQTEGVSNNWSQNKNTTQGQGSSESAGWSPRKLLLRNTDAWTHLLRENETTNRGTNQSMSVSEGSSAGGGRSTSQSLSRTENVSRGWNESETTGTSLSRTDSQSRSLSEGRSSSLSQSQSSTTSTSESLTETEGLSRGVTQGTTESRADGTHESSSQTTSENAQARRLISPEDMGVYFDRPEEGNVGFALVLVGGRRPTVVARTPYFSDPFFEWLFNPHPGHPAPPKRVGTQTYSLPETTPGVAGGLQPLCALGAQVARGQTIAELRVIERFDEPSGDVARHFRRVSPIDFGFPDPLPDPLLLEIKSPAAGRVVSWQASFAIDQNHGSGDPFVELEVDRRNVGQLGAGAASEDIERYSAYLQACHESASAAHVVDDANKRAEAGVELECVTARLEAIGEETRAAHEALNDVTVREHQYRREARTLAEAAHTRSFQTVWGRSVIPYWLVSVPAGLVTAGVLGLFAATALDQPRNDVVIGTIGFALCLPVLMGMLSVEHLKFKVKSQQFRAARKSWETLTTDELEQRELTELPRVMPEGETLATMERERQTHRDRIAELNGELIACYERRAQLERLVGK